MRISDWSSDVCSSDLAGWPGEGLTGLPLYLVGGSWRALSRLDLELTKDPLAVLDQHTLPRGALRRLTRATKRLSFEELRAIAGMASNRAAALPDAAALLAALVNILEVPEMTVSSSGLREGLLYQALDPETRAQDQIGRAHVCTPVTNAHLVCRLLL